MKIGQTVIYTMPADQGGREVRVNIVDQSRDGSMMIRLELIRNKPDFRWVGKTELKPLPPPPLSPVQQEFL
jgi:hypothetical protein